MQVIIQTTNTPPIEQDKENIPENDLSTKFKPKIAGKITVITINKLLWFFTLKE